jgi:4'-phosphopantetheinyl transferase EntD
VPNNESSAKNPVVVLQTKAIRLCILKLFRVENLRRHCEHPDLLPLTLGLPDLHGTALVLAPIADYRGLLFSDENSVLESMAEKRQQEFSSGRYCAHRCQTLLELDPAPILREERAPLWPTSAYTGSISHCDIAAVATITTAQKSIGVDIERTDRVKDKLFNALFTQNERAILAGLPKVASAVAFSAKEAGYKAIFPIGGQFIGFHEATVALNWSARTFSIEYLGAHAKNSALHSGTGYWQVKGNYVLTIFVIN